MFKKSWTNLYINFLYEMSPKTSWTDKFKLSWSLGDLVVLFIDLYRFITNLIIEILTHKIDIKWKLNEYKNKFCDF